MFLKYDGSFDDYTHFLNHLFSRHYLYTEFLKIPISCRTTVRTYSEDVVLMMKNGERGFCAAVKINTKLTQLAFITGWL